MNETAITQLTRLSPKSGGKVAIGHVPIRKVYVCMSVCVQLPYADRLTTFPNRERLQAA